MEYPVLQIACIQEFSHEAYETVVFYALFEYADHYIVVYIVEKSFNVSFDKPFCPNEIIL